MVWQSGQTWLDMARHGSHALSTAAMQLAQIFGRLGNLILKYCSRRCHVEVISCYIEIVIHSIEISYIQQVLKRQGVAKGWLGLLRRFRAVQVKEETC